MESIALKCKFDILSKPTGSVLFSEGETVVIAGIYGPIESKQRNILIDRANIEMYYRPKSGLPNVQTKFHENVLKNACESALATALYPRASVMFIIQELQDNGELISCAINATCLAALDSGIDMKYMFASSTCYLLDDGTFALQLPSGQSEKGKFVFAFDSLNEMVIVSLTEGSFTKDEYQQALECCRASSKHVFEFFKTTVKNRLRSKNG